MRHKATENMMTIIINIGEKFTNDAAFNKKKHWFFEDQSSFWKVSSRGSFKQACTRVRYIYRNAFKTNYGILLVTDAKELEESPQTKFKF